MATLLAGDASCTAQRATKPSAISTGIRRMVEEVVVAKGGDEEDYLRDGRKVSGNVSTDELYVDSFLVLATILGPVPASRAQ